jgi:hypothetical protein
MNVSTLIRSPLGKGQHGSGIGEERGRLFLRCRSKKSTKNLVLNIGAIQNTRMDKDRHEAFAEETAIETFLGILVPAILTALIFSLVWLTNG